MPCSDTHFIPILDELRSRPDPENQTQNQSASHPRKSAANSGRRGGRRPGAGAPRGNLNGLKSCPEPRRDGHYSKQLAQVGLIFAANPKIREALNGIARGHQLKQQKAEEVAGLMFARILERGIKVTTEQQRRDILAFKDSN